MNGFNSAIRGDEAVKPAEWTFPVEKYSKFLPCVRLCLCDCAVSNITYGGALNETFFKAMTAVGFGSG